MFLPPPLSVSVSVSVAAPVPVHGYQSAVAKETLHGAGVGEEDPRGREGCSYEEGLILAKGPESREGREGVRFCFRARRSDANVRASAARGGKFVCMVSWVLHASYCACSRVQSPQTRGQSFSSLLAPVDADADAASMCMPASDSVRVRVRVIDSRLPTLETHTTTLTVWSMEAGTRRALLARSLA